MNVSEELKRIQQEKHKKNARSNVIQPTNTELPQTTSKQETKEEKTEQIESKEETKIDWDAEIAAQLQKQLNHIDDQAESKENENNNQPFISAPMHSLIRQLAQRHNNNGVSFSFSTSNSNNAPSRYHMSFSGMDSSGNSWNFHSNSENENSEDLLNFLNMRGYQDDMISSMFNRMRNGGVDTDHMSYEELLDRFPIIQQGLNEQEINNNSIVDKYKEMEKKKDDKKIDKVSQECSICLEPFKKDDEIRRLPCLHIFHKKEIDQWLKTKDACPICRVSLKSD